MQLVALSVICTPQRIRPREKSHFWNDVSTKSIPCGWNDGEGRGEATRKTCFIAHQWQLTVCKQVEKSGKIENQKTFRSLQPLTSYHYLHFSATVIKFFLYCLWEEGWAIGMFWAWLKLLIMKWRSSLEEGFCLWKTFLFHPLMVTEWVPLQLRSLLNFHTW